jgi:hypothetical protein
MIQRIQSIWLLLAAITISCLLFLPMASSTTGTSTYQLLATGLYQKTGDQVTKIEGFLPLMISTIAVAAMCVFNIFNFRKRMVQKRLSLTIIVFIILLAFWCSRYAQKIPGYPDAADYKVGMFLPVIAIFFVILAIRGINVDDKLLRSADRLR